ncbi:hypothetical protein DY218_18680 [Streptomyces triticagri]|uniref:Uncharacterized protein n=1 Tax=Streptomyces triticagri TaxID=2293568 RepID=A0A372M3T2_9ACTN|nr:hypothetical protein [Streptomyces triticagri]RFU85185.1 hypothetical protein DY218_18680 [Streptomyces triticagri]
MNIRPLVDLAQAWATQVREGIRKDAGYSTETIVVTALLAIMAITVIGIITGKVVGKAGGIDLG